MPVKVVDASAVVAADLAVRLGLTAYDAAYVWVAHSLDAELVTLDRRLEKAHRLLARA
ncbi:MAG: hypothetical protein ACHQ50_15885 [Fimbriimonadales bacterium]